MAYVHEKEDPEKTLVFSNKTLEVIDEDPSGQEDYEQYLIQQKIKSREEGTHIDPLDLSKMKFEEDFLNKDYSSIIENAKKVPTLTQDAIEMLEKDLKIRKYQQRDITLFCIVHEDLTPELQNEFKTYMNAIIDNYISKDITYLIKIHSHVPYEQTTGIDCFTDPKTRKTELNGIYSRGNCWREVIDKIPIEKRDSFLKFKAGFLGLKSEEDLERLTMLRSNECYSVFEIIQKK